MYGAKPTYSEDSFNQREFSTGQLPLASDAIVVKSGAVLVAGSVLGKVTATGKWIKSVSTAVDGSQVPRRIAAIDVDATGGDKNSSAYVHGQFIFEGLDVDASWTYDTLKAAIVGDIFIVHGTVPQD